MRTSLLWYAGLGAVCLISAEAAVRVEDRLRYGTPFFSPYRGIQDLQVTDRMGAHARPDARFGKWALDSFGLRNPPVPTLPPEGTARLVVAGASETFGLYESAGREYPARLAAELEAAVARSGCAGRVEVLNAAFAGMSLPTVIQDVRLRLARLHPHSVLYYPSPAQYLEESAPTATKPSEDPRPALPAWSPLWPRLIWRIRTHAKALTPGPVLAALRRRAVAKARAAEPADWVFQTVPQERLSQFDRDLRSLVGAIREIGAIPILATHTNAFAGTPDPSGTELGAWARFYPRAEALVLPAFDSAAAQVVRAVARDSAISVADLWAGLRRDRSAPERFADFAHFTDAGAQLAAGLMGEVATPVVLSAAGCTKGSGRP